MTSLPFCPHVSEHEARITWVNASTGLQDTGPACGVCLAVLWDRLSRFPDAVATATIHPLFGEAA